MLALPLSGDPLCIPGPGDSFCPRLQLCSVGAAPASDPRAAHAGQPLVQRTLHDTAAAIFIYRICTLPVEIFAQICRYLHLPAPLAPCSPCHTLHEGDIYIALEIFALFALVCRNICNSCISSLDPLNPCPVCNVTRVHVRSAGAGLQVAGAAGGGRRRLTHSWNK